MYLNINIFVMGWHYILRCKCNVLPEFIPFIENEYMVKLNHKDIDKIEGQELEEDEKDNIYNTLSQKYKNLIDIWKKLNIGYCFYKYSLQGSQFSFEICKKVNRHEGDLQKDYETFLRDIIVYITDEISECTIESDDFGDFTWHYTDTQLRDIRFTMSEKIKCVEHVYDENSDIIETRVFYKHPIKKIQHLDLERSYTRGW
jgi:hypothetical protein